MFLKVGKIPMFGMDNNKGLKVLSFDKVKGSPATNRVHAVLN